MWCGVCGVARGVCGGPRTHQHHGTHEAEQGSSIAATTRPVASHTHTHIIHYVAATPPPAGLEYRQSIVWQLKCWEPSHSQCHRRHYQACTSRDTYYYDCHACTPPLAPGLPHEEADGLMPHLPCPAGHPPHFSHYSIAHNIVLVMEVWCVFHLVTCARTFTGELCS